tara:strand:- start:586 stop:1323 length:738 start_codon:yes stop_codon:yes gene_type:complete
MDSDSQIGGAKPKLKLKSTSISKKTASNKNKKTDKIAEDLATSVGKTITKDKEDKEDKKDKDKILEKDKGKKEIKGKAEKKGKGVKINKVKNSIKKEDKSVDKFEDEKNNIKIKTKEKEKKKKSIKKKSKITNPKSSKEEIINLNDSQLDSKEYDYHQIIMNYDINKNKSVNILTQYEISVIIGKRASQIAMGALPLIKVTSNMNHIDIAEEELRQKKTPFIIKREIGERAEYWKIEDLELSDTI